MKDALIIVDHGSKRDSANAMLAELAAVFPAGRFVTVQPAHMELAEPSIARAFARCIAAGAERVIVSQFFLAPGRHAKADIPRLVREAAGEHPFLITEPLGIDSLLISLMLQRIEEAKTCAAIDAFNAVDPKGEAEIYGQRMSARLAEFAPGASMALRIAARSQHIRRWEIPRDSYPATRQGYHQWRRALYTFHAETAAVLLRELGHDEALIERVAQLLQKKDLRTDAEAQALEDVACLVFVEHYLADFAGKHEREKLLGIIRRTWDKMSPNAHAAAVKLDLPEAVAELLQAAF
jgi:hypothetical protein